VKKLAASHRWWVVGIFFLSSTINYLDRQTLATLAPLLRAEFHLSNTDYGLILTAFSVTYAVGAPFAGLLVDRIGLNRGITLAIAVWSLAGVATGLVRGSIGLVGCRAVLGLSEAGGIPAAGKAMHQYLFPRERALGNGLNQAAVSLGLILAPPVATWLAVRHEWRTAFVATGCLGLLWIPLWHWMSRRAEPVEGLKVEPARQSLEILRDRRLWGFMAANALNMSVYSLWTNWTTLYLVDVNRLTLVKAAWYAWIPPVFLALGGFAGGWLSLRWITRGAPAIAARTRVCLVTALASLATAAIPLLAGAAWTALGISWSVFFVSAGSVNMYTMPLDVFAGSRAAFAFSLLVSSYGVVQAVISPGVGKLVDAYGYAPVCVLASLMPLAAWVVLKGTEARS
jgi:ACS family hexuronate transporter-like MFS transporter